jgi:hypothetical protein
MCYRKLFLAILIFYISANLIHAQEKYAILITGESAGEDANTDGSWIANNNKSTWDEFWNDTYLMWEMLVFDKGYADENVFVLYANGIDYTYPEQTIRYKAENHIGYTQITDMSAIKENVEAVFNGLSTGNGGFPQLFEDDFLYVFTFGHGDYAYDISNTYHVILTLMGYILDPTHQTWDEEHSIADFELQNLLDNINCQKKVICMQQCYSGGFIPYLQNPNTIIFTAANSEMIAHSVDEKYFDNISFPGDPDPGTYYYSDEEEQYGVEIHEYGHGEFNFHLLNALRGETPNHLTDYIVPDYGTFPLSDADDNQDNLISIYEAANWVKDYDSWQRYVPLLWGGWDDPTLSPDGGITYTTTLEYPTIIIEDIAISTSLLGIIGIPVDIHITTGAQLTFLSDADIYLLNNAKLIVDEGATIITQDNCEFHSVGDFNSIEINGFAQFGSNNTFTGNLDDDQYLWIIPRNTNDLVFNNASFTKVHIDGWSNNFDILYSDLINSTIKYSMANITVDNCEFSNSNLTISKNVESVRQANINKCFFHNYSECPLFIRSYDDYFIDSCTIENNGGDGICIHYSGGGVAARFIRNCIIQNNGEIETNDAAGIRIYSSVAQVYTNNYIAGNPYGIQCLNQSDVLLMGNSLAQYVYETQNIIYNDINQVYATHYSFPHYFHWNAVIYNYNPYPLVYHDIIPGTNPEVDVRVNYWSTDFDPEEDLYGGRYIWEPIWELSQGGGIDAYADEQMYNNAITQIADSIIQNNTSLKKTADFLVAMSEIERENYTYAIDHFDSIILNPDTYEDSLFAIIDLAYTYDLMWDTTNRSNYIGIFPQYKYSTTEEYEKSREYHIDLLFKKRKENQSIDNQNNAAIESKSHFIKVFPNPFNDKLSISLTSKNQDITRLKIYDITGREVYKSTVRILTTGENIFDINLSELSKDMYFYSLSIDNTIIDNGKIIKN